jgi:tetratricopeptide (TPR) repeat protein
MDPDFPRSGMIIYAYVAAGKFADALAQLEQAAGKHQLDTPSLYAMEAYIYGRWGRPAEAQRAFSKFEEEIKRHRLSEPDSSRMLMSAYMGMDRDDDVVALLGKFYEEYRNSLVSLKVDPFYAPLRGEPGFQQLLRTANLAR